MAFCTKCGRTRAGSESFCTGCGAPFTAEATSAWPAAPVTATAWPTPAGPPPGRSDLPTQTAGPPPGRSDLPTQTAGPPGPVAGRGARGNRQRLLVTGLAVLAAGGVTAVLVIARPFDHQTGPPVGQRSTVPASSVPGSTARTSLASPASPAARSPSALPVRTEQQVAGSLAALLAQSLSDRSSVVAAYNDVAQCGPGLGQDARTFASAARSRKQLLSQLGAMPSRSALPGPMLADLTSAWQASIQADNDFAAWARDQAAGGCIPNGGSDRQFRAATGPDNRATADKTAFVRLWNPLAQRYHLTAYQAGQL